MLYAEIINGTVTQYPLTIMQIRAMYPNISWPDDPDSNDLLTHNLYEIYAITAPTITKHQTLSEGEPVYNETEARWEQNWIVTNKDLAQAKSDEKSYLASVRWENETRGTLWDYDGQGDMVDVITDAASQAKLAAAYTLAQQGYWVSGKKWKFSDGVFRSMTTAQVMSMALACSSHVQNCFERESVISSQIDSATTLAEVENWTWEE